MIQLVSNPCMARWWAKSSTREPGTGDDRFPSKVEKQQHGLPRPTTMWRALQPMRLEMKAMTSGNCYIAENGPSGGFLQLDCERVFFSKRHWGMIDG